MGILSGIWKYVAAAAGLAMTVLYALWQRKRAEHAEDKADRAEAKAQRADDKAEKQHEVAKARNRARKEAENNAEKKRKALRERSASLNNDRL